MKEMLLKWLQSLWDTPPKQSPAPTITHIRPLCYGAPEPVALSSYMTTPSLDALLLYLRRKLCCMSETVHLELYGLSGTGKSHSIHALTTLFDRVVRVDSTDCLLTTEFIDRYAHLKPQVLVFDNVTPETYKVVWPVVQELSLRSLQLVIYIAQTRYPVTPHPHFAFSSLTWPTVVAYLHEYHGVDIATYPALDVEVSFIDLQRMSLANAYSQISVYHDLRTTPFITIVPSQRLTISGLKKKCVSVERCVDAKYNNERKDFRFICGLMSEINNTCGHAVKSNNGEYYEGTCQYHEAHAAAIRQYQELGIAHKFDRQVVCTRRPLYRLEDMYNVCVQHVNILYDCMYCEIADVLGPQYLCCGYNRHKVGDTKVCNHHLAIAAYHNDPSRCARYMINDSDRCFALATHMIQVKRVDGCSDTDHVAIGVCAKCYQEVACSCIDFTTKTRCNKYSRKCIYLVDKRTGKQADRFAGTHLPICADHKYSTLEPEYDMYTSVLRKELYKSLGTAFPIVDVGAIREYFAAITTQEKPLPSDWKQLLDYCLEHEDQQLGLEVSLQYISIVTHCKYTARTGSI